MRPARYAHRGFFSGLILVAAAGISFVIAGAQSADAQAADAQSVASTPSAVSETQGAATGLGSSHRFQSAAAASAHCSNDTVIWSSGPKLIYVLPASPKYGKGGGFYACKGEADDAGFHSAE